MYVCVCMHMHVYVCVCGKREWRNLSGRGLNCQVSIELYRHCDWSSWCSSYNNCFVNWWNL